MSEETTTSDSALMDPVTVAQRLAGRDLSSEEIADFYRVKEALGLADNDAIWTILLAFGHYKTLYEGIPARIRDMIITIIAEAKVTVNATAEAAERTMISRIERDAVEAVKRMVDDARKAASTAATATNKQRLTIISAGAAFVAFITAALLLYGGYQLGVSSNAVELAWLNTRDGQTAKRFAELNNVPRMMECAAPHTVVEKSDGTYCSPYEAKTQTVRMWRIK